MVVDIDAVLDVSTFWLLLLHVVLLLKLRLFLLLWLLLLPVLQGVLLFKLLLFLQFQMCLPILFSVPTDVVMAMYQFFVVNAAALVVAVAIVIQFNAVSTAVAAKAASDAVIQIKDISIIPVVAAASVVCYSFF